MAEEALSKSQIDKIGHRLKQGRLDRDVLEKLNAFRKSCLPLYEEVQAFCSICMGLEATGRAQKSTAAIIGKLSRESIRLSQMQDIAGVRVIVADLVEQDMFIAQASRVFVRLTVDDKRKNPTNGYRAVHLICERAGRYVELQVRTRSQHAWAELSEKFADEVGQDLKYGKGNEELLEFLERLSVLSWRLESVRHEYRLLVTAPVDMHDRLRVKRQRKELQSREGSILLAIRQLFIEARRRAARGAI